MICPRCNKTIDFGVQMTEWDQMYGDGAQLQEEFPIMINLICEHCKDSAGLVFIEAVEGSTEVDSPVGKVKIPSIKRQKKE